MTGRVSRWWTIAWPIVLVLAPVLAFGACVYYAHRPLDIAEYAQSDEVAAADQQSITRINDELVTIGEGAPWLEPLGDEIADKCHDFGRAAGGGDQSVSCGRHATRYYGFDGDFVGRTKALTPVLNKAGWYSLDLRRAADDYSEHAGATDLVTVGGRRTGDHALMEMAWAQRPAPFSVDDDIDRGRQPHEPDTAYREVRPLDVVAFTKSAFEHHQFVLRLTITDVYAGDFGWS